ncbi:hypothetical protein [Streptomyces sp. NPDC058678]|uniref:hypothetical protein n=1 Tax=Streptomyces sp. NPDC058678 TaxID=3346595 RepID=UPI00366471AE
MKTNRRTRGPQEPKRSARAAAWVRRRRHAMLSSALRGAAYAAGSGSVGLVIWWIQGHQL